MSSPDLPGIADRVSLLGTETAFDTLAQVNRLRAQGRAEDAEPMLAEAREIFERLEATPWLERMATPLAVTP